jgi:hypothetical protein
MPCLNCRRRRFTGGSSAGSDSRRKPFVNLALAVAFEAGSYFNPFRPLTPGLDSLKGLWSELSLLAKFFPRN